jgi:hypothetical protein
MRLSEKPSTPNQICNMWPSQAQDTNNMAHHFRGVAGHGCKLFVAVPGGVHWPSSPQRLGELFVRLLELRGDEPLPCLVRSDFCTAAMRQGGAETPCGSANFDRFVNDCITCGRRRCILTGPWHPIAFITYRAGYQQGTSIRGKYKGKKACLPRTDATLVLLRKGSQASKPHTHKARQHNTKGVPRGPISKHTYCRGVRRVSRECCIDHIGHLVYVAHVPAPHLAPHPVC